MCNYNDDCGGWLTGVLCVVFLGFFLLALYHIAIEPQVLSNSQIEGAEFSKRRLVGREMSKMGKKQRKKNKNLIDMLLCSCELHRCVSVSLVSYHMDAKQHTLVPYSSHQDDELLAKLSPCFSAFRRCTK